MRMLHRLFIIFLFIYALLIIVHVLEIHWTLQVAIIFACGLLLALIAHAKNNYIVIIILILHMGIEWIEWSHEILRWQQIIFNAIHAVMDFVFLSHELKVHARQYRKIIISGVLGLLMLILASGRYIQIGERMITNLEPFVIGGVLGCVLSHLYFHIKKE